jgi:hypothetical protein
MTTTRRPPSSDRLYRRIDEMHMSVTDRELAKARLRTGERLADALCVAAAVIRSGAAFVARHLRTVAAPSAQH